MGSIVAHQVHKAKADVPTKALKVTIYNFYSGKSLHGCFPTYKSALKLMINNHIDLDKMNSPTPAPSAFSAF